MIFEQIPIDGDKNFAYLFGDEGSGEVVAVDPGASPRVVFDRIKAHNATCKYILATHSHWDHVAGVDELQSLTGAPFAAFENVSGVDHAIHDGDTLSVGAVAARMIFCPGHAPDSLLVVINDEKVLVGDELFIGGVGITRSESQARLHHANLHAKLLALPDHLEVFAGHDYGAKPSSTIGEQRKTNPYLLQKDFESFWHLRQNWKAYVKEHGLQWG